MLHLKNEATSSKTKLTWYVWVLAVRKATTATKHFPGPQVDTFSQWDPSVFSAEPCQTKPRQASHNICSLCGPQTGAWANIKHFQNENCLHISHCNRTKVLLTLETLPFPGTISDQTADDGSGFARQCQTPQVICNYKLCKRQVLFYLYIFRSPYPLGSILLFSSLLMTAHAHDIKRKLVRLWAGGLQSVYAGDARPITIVECAGFYYNGSKMDGSPPLSPHHHHSPSLHTLPLFDKIYMQMGVREGGWATPVKGVWDSIPFSKLWNTREIVGGGNESDKSAIAFRFVYF